MSIKTAGLILYLVLMHSHSTLIAQNISEATFSEEEINIITDPSRLYKLVGLYSLYEENEVQKFRKKFLKFYAAGKVRTFYEWNSRDVTSLEPKNSNKGHYKIKKGQLILNLHFKHPQGGGYIKHILHKIENGYIYLHSGTFIEKYEIISLPPQFLIYDEEVSD